MNSAVAEARTAALRGLDNAFYVRMKGFIVTCPENNERFFVDKSLLWRIRESLTNKEYAMCTRAVNGKPIRLSVKARNDLIAAYQQKVLEATAAVQEGRRELNGAWSVEDINSVLEQSVLTS